MNACFKKFISLLMEPKMHIVMDNFKQWHMLPNIQGTIDYAHVLGYKPFILFPKDLIIIIIMGDVSSLFVLWWTITTNSLIFSLVCEKMC